MKHSFNIKSVIGMGIAVMACAGIVTIQSGCSKSSSSSPAKDTLSSASVAASIQSMVISGQAGIAPQAEANANMYQSMGLGCGTVLDTTMSGNSTSGGMTIVYNLTYADTCFCTGGVATKVDFYMNSLMDMTMSGTYYGGKNRFWMSMSGLDAASTNYTVSETCAGTDTIKETSPQNLTCYMNINCTASNVVISKGTNPQILSGTSTVQYSYTTTSGNSYNESATVKYIGGMQAVITLANGYTTTVTY